MSGLSNRGIEARVEQPASFAFTAENQAKIPAILAKYPKGQERSAVLPLLQLAQVQHDNWLPRAAMDHVAAVLEMPRIRVYEVATFYSMFNLTPVGRHFVQVCTTTPCWLMGSDGLVETCKKRIGPRQGRRTEDGGFSWVEVECLGACVNGPMVQINDDYYEDLTPEALEKVLDALETGAAPAIGSQTGRRGSMAQSGPTSLADRAGQAGVAMNGEGE